MKLNKYTVATILALVIVSASLFTNQPTAHSRSSQPPTKRTGAPGEGSCTSCHSGGTVSNSANITVTSNPSGLFTTGYVAGQVYAITYTLANTTSVYGFEMTCLNGSSTAAGTFAVTNSTNTSLQAASSKQYIGHRNSNSNNTWTFNWTAPVTGTGNVTFYTSGLQADGTGGPDGDITNTNNWVVAEAAAPDCSSFASVISGGTAVCAGSPTVLTASSSGGTGTDTYHWSDNSTAQTLSATAAGTYSVTVSNGGCTATTSTTLGTSTPGTAAFSVTVDASGAHITNNSTNAAISSWAFGDGNAFANNNSQFTYGYTAVGTYHLVLTVTDNCGANITHDTTITVSTPTGINNVVNPNVSIYPNPVIDHLNILVEGNHENYQVRIYNMNGKLVQSAQGITGNLLQLTRDGLANGVYVYHIILHGKSVTGRFVVQ